ncbi:hypothetical protein CL614_02230 [archaeon]|nr:hypothetical protein [archaeon]|tara:strand:+ start:1370 stop:1618 length:249 start_codon:yes stop_codon:yes gene_type:complete
MDKRYDGLNRVAKRAGNNLYEGLGDALASDVNLEPIVGATEILFGHSLGVRVFSAVRHMFRSYKEKGVIVRDEIEYAELARA